MLLSPITHYNQYSVQRGRLHMFENMIQGEDIICLLSFINSIYIAFIMRATYFERLIIANYNILSIMYN